MIQELRQLVIKAEVGGTSTISNNATLYKDGYGYVTIIYCVPNTPNTTDYPICSVYKSSTDIEGHRIISPNNYNMLYVGTKNINRFEYRIFSIPCPREFTDTEGGLTLVFNYGNGNPNTLDETGKATEILDMLVSSHYNTTVKPGGWNNTGITLEISSQEAAQINKNTIAIEQLSENIDGLKNIQIGNVETVPNGEPAEVINVGTDGDVILDFKIPEGKVGSVIGMYVCPVKVSDWKPAENGFKQLIIPNATHGRGQNPNLIVTLRPKVSDTKFTEYNAATMTGTDGTVTIKTLKAWEGNVLIAGGAVEISGTKVLINNIAQAEVSFASDPQRQIDALRGVGGYLNSYDFGTPAPTQQQLTDYALSEIPNITEKTQIFNGTRVVNLNNNQIWILTNTPNTEPPIFEWANGGFNTVSTATDTTLGVVKGGGNINVSSDGTLSTTPSLIGAATAAQGAKADNAIQFVNQALTVEQQQQARDNIGAQEKLTLDETPTEGSNNPVTSAGIKTAITNHANTYATSATRGHIRAYVSGTTLYIYTTD